MGADIREDCFAGGGVEMQAVPFVKTGIQIVVRALESLCRVEIVQVFLFRQLKQLLVVPVDGIVGHAGILLGVRFRDRQDGLDNQPAVRRLCEQGVDEFLVAFHKAGFPHIGHPVDAEGHEHDVGLSDAHRLGNRQQLACAQVDDRFVQGDAVAQSVFRKGVGGRDLTAVQHAVDAGIAQKQDFLRVSVPGIRGLCKQRGGGGRRGFGGARGTRGHGDGGRRGRGGGAAGGRGRGKSLRHWADSGDLPLQAKIYGEQGAAARQDDDQQQANRSPGGGGLTMPPGSSGGGGQSASHPLNA